jgi:hypothetical protein
VLDSRATMRCRLRFAVARRQQHPVDANIRITGKGELWQADLGAPFDSGVRMTGRGVLVTPAAPR